MGGPLLTLFNVSFSAAQTAFIECSLYNESKKNSLKDDDPNIIETDSSELAAKNSCCFFARGKYTIPTTENFIGYMYMQMKTLEAMGEKCPGFMDFFMTSRTNLNSPKHHKGGLPRMLWSLYGPAQMHKFGKKLIKKVESLGYDGIDHRFGIESFQEEIVQDQKHPQTTKAKGRNNNKKKENQNRCKLTSQQ